MPRSKKQKTIEPFWSDLVAEYFKFCKEKFDEIPSFDGSAPRDLKSIISALRLRAESLKIEWTHETATTRWRHFLEFAFTDRWLSENWLLSNLNRQKDKIFFKIRQQFLGNSSKHTNQ